MSETKFIASEADGIKAIQFLQKQVGIDETEADARVGWNAMSPSAQQQTMGVYASMSGNTTVLYRRPITLAKPEPKTKRAKINSKHSRPVPAPHRKS